MKSIFSRFQWRWDWVGILGLLSITILPAMFFQNCGDVNIAHRSARTDLNAKNLSGDVVSYLQPQLEADSVYRAVLFVDMSRSMYAGPCPDSVDTFLPGVVASSNCLGPTGADPDYNRIQIAIKWIEKLEQAVTDGHLQPDQAKIKLMFFSGGHSFMGGQVFWDSFLNYSGVSALLGPTAKDNFLNLAVAKKTLYFVWALLTKKNSQPMPAAIPADVVTEVTTGSSKNMNPATGTSVPKPVISKLNTDLSKELGILKTAGLSNKAKFEIIFFSDGVPKPHPLHIYNMSKFIWSIKTTVRGNYYGTEITVNLKSCIVRCDRFSKEFAETGTYTLPTSEYWSPSPGQSQYNKQAYYGAGLCDSCMEGLMDFANSGSPQALRYAVEAMWGESAFNFHPTLFLEINTLLNVFKNFYPEARMRMNFLRLDSPVAANRTPAAEMDPEINWFEKAKKIFTKKHRFYTIMNSNLPFDLFSEAQPIQNYKVGSLIAINLNTRIGPGGRLELDSDGDGLSDSLETANSLKHYDPRSDGVCLDSIKHSLGGCLSAGCDSQLDVDGDGLNQCEERTLGSDEFDFDSDGDGIPDGFEMLFGLNPTSSDSNLDTNSDRFTNREQFLAGVKPTVIMSTVPGDKQVNFQATFVDYQNVTHPSGIVMSVPGYRLNLKSMPLVQTVAATDGLSSFSAAAKQPADAITNKVIGGAHAAEVNRILFLVRIDNQDNAGDRTWMMLNYDVPFSNPPTMDIRFELFQPFKTVDP